MIDYKKHQKLAKTLTPLLIMLLITITTNFTFAANQQNQPENNINTPENAAQYNRTETIPQGQIEQITNPQTHIFSYKNLTLMFNCTQNCELKITTDPSLSPKILSLSVEPTQNMTLTMNMTKNPPTNEQPNQNKLQFYLQLEPNINTPLTAQIRLQINQTQIQQETGQEANISRLTWMYWNQTGMEWAPVPSWMDQNNYLICNTTHFSTWTIAETTNPNTPTSTPTASSQEIPTSSTETATPQPTETPNPTESKLQTQTPSTSLNPQESKSEQEQAIQTEYIYITIAVIIFAVLIISITVYTKKTKLNKTK